MKEKRFKGLFNPKESLLIMGIYFLIAGVWYAYEWMTLGELQKNGFDTIIAIVLTLSLYLNIVLFRRLKS